MAVPLRDEQPGVRPGPISPAAPSLLGWLQWRRDNQPARIAFRHKRNAIWHEVTWHDLYDEVATVAVALESLGIGPGDRVLLLGLRGRDWPCVELAVHAVGAVVCAVDDRNLEPENLAGTQRSLMPALVVLESAEGRDELLGVAVSQRATQVLVTGSGRAAQMAVTDKVASLGELRGQQSGTDSAKWLRQAIAQRSPDDVVRVTLSSGVGSDAKLVQLTSRDIIQPWQSLIAEGGWEPPGEHDRTVSLQPTSRTSELVVSLMLPLIHGAVAHFPEGWQTRDIDLTEVAPTIVYGSPRLWQLWTSGVVADMKDAGRVKRRVFAGLSHSRSRAVRPLWWALLRQPLLAKLGLGRVRIALTGGAAVPRSLLETWRSWGLPLVELYGSAETADVAAFRPPSAAVDSPLTVLPHVRGRIADNGELQLATGPGISAAYIGADGPTDTRPAELATGDLARLDGDRLSLLGRLDNRTIVSGTAFSLDSIEAQLVDNNLARTAIVLCRDDKHAVALLELNFRELAVRARKAGVSYTSYESLVTTGFAHESCGEFVGKTNADLAAQGITGIADYRIVPRELRVESGELTATGKIRRHRIIESFGSLIDDMYTSMNVGRGSHA